MRNRLPTKTRTTNLLKQAILEFYSQTIDHFTNNGCREQGPALAISVNSKVRT